MIVSNLVAILYVLFKTKALASPLTAIGFQDVSWKTTLWVGGTLYLTFVPIWYGAGSIEAILRGGEGSTQSSIQALTTNEAVGASVLFLIGVCAIVPILEEILFRGFLYPILRKRLGVPVAIAINGVAFALMHDGGRPQIFTIGVLLALLFEKTRSLKVVVLAHMFHNTMTIALIRLVHW